MMLSFRPYFSYWVTFVQIVIFIVSVAVYGIAPIGISTTKVSANVSSCTVKKTLKTEKKNEVMGDTSIIYCLCRK